MKLRVITDVERRRRLAVRHRLTPAGRTDDISVIADDLVALHSSDPATVYLSALVRMATPSIESVEDALYERRSVVRHHAMRRTLWVMTPDVAQLAHAAATKTIAAAERKRTLKALVAAGKVSDAEAWLDEAVADVITLLGTKGPMATRAVGQALPHLVTPLVYGSQKHAATLNAHTKVLQGAGFEGMLMRGKPSGTWISSEYPWATTQSWMGSELDGGEKRGSAASLVELWLRRFGPASETDIAWWFGWTKTVLRQALADVDAQEVVLETGTPAWVSATDVGSTDELEPWVRLLPGLDPTVMGWKERDWYVDPAYVTPLYDRNGNAGPTIWADGRVVGGWIQRPDGSIAFDLLEPLGPSQKHLLDEAIDEMRSCVGDVIVRPRFPALTTAALTQSVADSGVA